LAIYYYCFRFFILKVTLASKEQNQDAAVATYLTMQEWKVEASIKCLQEDTSKLDQHTIISKLNAKPGS